MHDPHALPADRADALGPDTHSTKTASAAGSGEPPPGLPDDVTAALPGPGATQTHRAAETAGPAFSGELPCEFGDYTLLAELGRGGMGVVYRAQQHRPQRIVALKMIRAGQLADGEDVQRFYAEAEAAAHLDHPGIVPVYEVGAHAGQHFFSMGYVQGTSLAARLRDGPLAPRDAAALVQAVALAAEYAHRRGVIHRDLKPANILVPPSDQSGSGSSRDPSGGPKIADFGLAKRLETDSNLTATGQILGTPSYMPPEQAAGDRAIGPAADVYALGAILYACLTGRPPFQAATVLDTLRQVLEDEPVPPRLLNPLLPRDLETICVKCLDKDPVRRYGSAQELADELERYLQDVPILARPAGRGERLLRWARRNRALASATVGTLLAVAAALVILVVAVLWISDSRDTEQKLRRDAEHEAAELLLERSLTRCTQAGPHEGVHWLVRSLRKAIEVGDRDLELAARWQLAGWLAELPELQAKYPILDAEGHLRAQPEEVAAADGQDQTQRHLFHIGACVLSPDGQTLLAAGLDRRAQLYEALTGRPIGPPLVHTNIVLAAAFSPDGRLVATAGDERIGLWDAATGQPIHEMLEHPTAVFDVAFSRDGMRLLTASGHRHETTEYGEVRLWDTATWTQLGEPWRLAAEVRRVAFSPDDLIAATATRNAAGDGQIQLWDVAAGQPRDWTIRPEHGFVALLSFSADGQRLLVTSGERARFFNLVDGQPVGPEFRHPGIIGAAAQDTAGELLLTGSDRAGRIWSTHDGQLVGALLVHPWLVWRVACDANAERALTATPDGMLHLWRLRSAQRTVHVMRQADWVVSAAFSPDGTRLVTGCEDGAVQQWDAATGQPLGAPLVHADSVRDVEYDPSGRHILSASWDQTARLWDAQTGAPVGAAAESQMHFRTAAFDQQGARFATGDYAGVVRVWAVPSGEPLTPPLVHKNGIRGVLFTADGSQLITAGEDRLVRIWDAATGELLGRPLEHPLQVANVVLSPDDAEIATACTDGIIRRWRLADGAPIGEPLVHDGVVYLVRYHVDGKRLVSGSDDGSVRVWDLSTSQQMGESMQHPDRVSALALSPDGELILSGCGDGAGRLWHLDSGMQIGPPLRHRENEIRAAYFSPDGTQIVTAGEDNTARIWPVPVPLAGSPEEIAAQVETLTGTTLDAQGRIDFLPVAQWRQRKTQLAPALAGASRP